MNHTRNRPLLSLATALLVAAPALAQDDSDVLSLVCTGSGTKKDTQTTYVNQYNRKTDEREYATANTTVQRPFSGTLYIELYGPLGRVKIPQAMVPPINSGSDGWFEIQKLEITDREISGRIKINGMNKPDMRIDRTTGGIELHSGFGQFSGQCEKYDKSAEARRF